MLNSLDQSTIAPPVRWATVPVMAFARFEATDAPTLASSASVVDVQARRPQ
jgi:hypothetical protein